MQVDRLKKNWWLYVLKLENDKWYVGITSKTPEERFAEHIAGKRAAYWTMANRPIEIELVEDLGVVSKQHAEKYENKITRALMKERGLNNVRGGDLRDVDEYVSRFGRIWDKEGWATVTYIVLLNLIILWLVMHIYDWSKGIFLSLIFGTVLIVLILRKFEK